MKPPRTLEQHSLFVCLYIKNERIIISQSQILRINNILLIYIFALLASM